MKISFLLIMFLLYFHLIYSQDSSTKSTYTFGDHGIEITLDAPWNVVQQTKDWYELLFGCSGTEKCANIQVNFWQKDIGGAIEENIENLIKEYKSSYNNFKYVKSIKMINDLQFLIVDLYAINNGLFLGQTVALANTKYEILDLTYTTNELRFHTKKAIEKYNEERNQFLDILSTIKSIDNEIEPKRSSDMTLLSCDDLNNILITHKDSLYCFIQLSGQASIRPDGEIIMINTNFLRSFLGYKEPFFCEDSSDNSDKAILYKFMGGMTNAIYLELGFQNSNMSKFYFATPIDSLNQQKGFIWYPLYISEKDLMKIGKAKPGSKYLQFERYAKIVFASKIVGDFIYSIQIFTNEGQSLNEIKYLLTDMIESLQYAYDTFEPQDLCPEIVLDL